MSLASAVVLLQTALSLLTLVNTNPSLPQSMRDNATAVAQHAISEAHAALASNGVPADGAQGDTPQLAQAAAASAASTQTGSLASSGTKAGPSYLYPVTKRPDIGSRVARESHARGWERLEVKVLRATRQQRRYSPLNLP